MITDDQLHRLAIFLGSCAMMMIVLYHFLEVNAKDDDLDETTAAKKSTNRAGQSVAASGASGSTATASSGSAIGAGKDR
ncbi:hypothetical protein FE257_002744 [Aspergillus nanangensis]|uniref:Dolichyl-diphosphooligosaccharide--protein glycosyltransferase subunit 4 n=1 Tax=Aspergillus nanangensis TaxID=2582783 RepID=A0AAD4CCQ1_ASPNN|nr:hypothetical protein FE257_002744 [Aspergillus nanangensis]